MLRIGDEIFVLPVQDVVRIDRRTWEGRSLSQEQFLHPGSTALSEAQASSLLDTMNSSAMARSATQF